MPLNGSAGRYKSGHLQAGVRLQQSLQAQPRDAEAFYAAGIAHLHGGRLEEALQAFDSGLALKPDFTDALWKRAAALVRLNRPAEAVTALDRFLALRPDHADGWNNRGAVLISIGRVDDALASFDRALAIQPHLVEALSNRSTMLHELKRFDEALGACDALVELAPDLAAGWNNRGNVLAALDRYDQAIQSYDKALAIEPGLPAAVENRDLALLELKRVTRCPPGYLRNLFDEFSSNYDETMIETLGYRAHLHLRALAERVIPKGATGRRILDLGSGTGLVGDAFKDMAAGGRLDGVDLSPLMIAEAQRRAIYNDLILGDIETFLAAFERSYDLILAADTMIYFGDLGPTLAGVFKRLVPGGFYIFAVEASPGNGWKQTDAKRFCHSENYLRTAAADAALNFVASMACVLRRQKGEPVPGLAVALQKPVS
ncbi:MAG TPA: tetratricopeptide repeat protein [Micropepsaceae bacterium]|nr:tetratricopeptide repeat protein [Micropepsaceae bacterium]